MNSILNVKVFEKYLSDHQLSKKDFCKTCGICFATLQKILEGDNHLRTSSLIRIHRATGIELYDMMKDREGYIILPK